MSENNRASVYVHINLINGKKYFGITTQELERRWQNGNGYYRNTHFMSAIKKYGWDNFGHFVLYRYIPIKIARNIEELLIKSHMSYDPRFGYNKTMGGELEIPTEETRRKLSKNNPAKRPEVAAKMSDAKKGENNPMKRPEVVAKIRKPVEAVDPESGQRALYFKSTTDAERAGFDQGHVSACCNGKRKTHYGYYWRFIEEVSDNDSDN